MSFVIKFVFRGDALLTIVLGGICFLVAALMSLRVVEVEPRSAVEPSV
jgi:hypothetical protein